MVINGNVISIASAGVFPFTIKDSACVITNVVPGMLNFQLEGTYTGQIHVGQSISGLSGVQITDNIIVNSNGVYGAIPANGTGIFSVPVSGRIVYLYASVLSSGSVTATPLQFLPEIFQDILS